MENQEIEKELLALSESACKSLNDINEYLSAHGRPKINDMESFGDLFGLKQYENGKPYEDWRNPVIEPYLPGISQIAKKIKDKIR